MSFGDEEVVSYQFAMRNIDSSGSGSGGSDSSLPGSGIPHVGIVMNTAKGNSYLVHHLGPFKPYAIEDAGNMTSKWRIGDPQKTSGHTVEDGYRAGDGNYFSVGTCIGSAFKTMRELDK